MQIHNPSLLFTSMRKDLYSIRLPYEKVRKAHKGKFVAFYYYTRLRNINFLKRVDIKSIGILINDLK